MSDFFKAMSTSEAQVIDSRIFSNYFSDYGIVKSVSEGKVDVILASTGSVWGKDTGEIIVPGVEILYPSSSGLSVEYEVKAGDGVLLIGLRTYIETVKGLSSAEKPKANMRYALENMKAIPLSVIRDDSGVIVTVKEDNYSIENKSGLIVKSVDDKLTIKNADKSLATVLVALIEEIKALKNAQLSVDFSGLIGSVTSAPGAVTFAGAVNVTASQSAVASSTKTNLDTIKSDLQAILEA